MAKEVIPVAGDRLSDGFPSIEKIVKCTFGATSGDVTCDTQAAFGLITIPQYAQITDVGWMVDKVFTDSVTITIGDTDAADGWAEAADCVATVADTGITWGSNHTGSDTCPAYTYSCPLLSSGPEDIDATIGGADPVTGQVSVYVKYHMAYGQKHF